MDENTLNQDIELLLQNAPPPVRAFILNELSETTQTLMEKHHLHVDQGDVLQTELLLTLVGEATPEEFVAALEEAGIPGEILAPLVTDVNDQIFKKIRSEESASTVTPALQGMVAQAPPAANKPVVPVATPTPPSVPPAATARAPVIHTPPAKPSATAAFEHPQPTPPRFPDTPSIPTPTLRPLTPSPARAESLAPIHYAAHAPMPVAPPTPVVPTVPVPPPAQVVPVPAAPTKAPTEAVAHPVQPQAREAAPTVRPQANVFTPLSAPTTPASTKGHAPTLEGATIRTMAKDMEATHDHKPAEPAPYHFEAATVPAASVSAPTFSPREPATPVVPQTPWPLPKAGVVADEAVPSRPAPQPPTNLPGQPKQELIKEYGTDPYREPLV